MFTRYSLTASSSQLAARFGVDVPDAYTPQYNAAPSHLLPLITDESPGGISFFYWGAPPEFAGAHALGEKIINTRVEQIAEKAVLKKKIRSHRCLVPADGFFLWKKSGKKSLIPHRVTLKDGSMFAMAAVWEEYDDAQGEMNHTFNVLTVPATDALQSLDERMPLVLPLGSEKDWLQQPDNLILEGKYPSQDMGWTNYTVGQFVNQPGKNDARTIRPAQAADQFGNLSLFD